MSRPDLPSRADRVLARPETPACMRGYVARGVGALSCRVRIEAPCVDSATEWGGLPGGRTAPAPRGVGAPRFRRWGAAAAHWLPTRPPSTGAAAEMIVLSAGCTGGGLPAGRAGMPCDDCTEGMYW